MPLPPTRCVMPDTHFYRYDNYDRRLIAERVAQFRDQVAAASPASSPRTSSSRCG